MPRNVPRVQHIMRRTAATVANTGNTTATPPDRTVHAPAPAPASTTYALSDDELGLAIGGGLLLVLLLAIVLIGVKRRRHQEKDRVRVVSPRPTRRSPKAPTPTVYLLDNSSFVSSSISFGSRVSCFLQEHPQDSPIELWQQPQVLAHRLSVSDIALEELVARGNSSEVYRGHYRDRIVAIKKPLPQWLGTRANLEAFFATVPLLASPSLTHPNFVAFLGVAWRSLAYVCLVTEFMAGGDLCSYLKQRRQHHALAREPFSRRGFCRTKLAIASQIASALSFLHAQGLVHGAVRSRNILLDEKMNAKLTGYLGSAVRPRKEPHELINEEPLMAVPPRVLTATVPTGVADKRRRERTQLDALSSAPEVLCGQRTNAKTDVFALGLVLSELDSLTAPYGFNSRFQEHCDGGELLEKVAAGHVRVHFASSRARHGRRGSPLALVNYRLTAAVVRLGKACVALDAFERPSAAQVSSELHKLMQMHDPKTGRTCTHEQLRTG